jgi:hypothetical protein
VPPLNKALLGARFEGGIELIDQRLNDRLEQFARRGENQVPEGPLETQ